MVLTFSPQRDAGGTLHCASPTSVHQVDALRQIQRSLSRSPSKAPDIRFLHSKPQSPSTIPLTPSPLSPSRRPFLFTASPHASPFSTGVKINRPSLRRSTPHQSSTRMKTSPRSPVKRVLSESLDNGNATHTTSYVKSGRDSAPFSRKVTPDETRDQENDAKFRSFGATEHAGSRFSISRLEKRRSGGNLDQISMSSPLKRSDGIMNLDQASLGSPAKRRSLHGATFGPDFNIFDHEPAARLHREESNSDEDEMASSHQQSAPLATSPFYSIPRRSSSLRKSTLQQRQNERPSYARYRPHAELSLEATPNYAKGRQRLSLDNNVPALQRESPFSNQASLPSASAHPVPQPRFTTNQAHNPHPLSRTMTQSSSNSSIVDESPTHEPTHRNDVHKKLDFSKSLPVGALRPAPPLLTQETSKVSSNGSFSTPESYKFAKPLPAAFMSTGLISKKNRNVDDQPQQQAETKAQMPDTPCKRPLSLFATTQITVPDSVISKPRQMRHSFGTPSTPFNPHATAIAPVVYGQGSSIFGSTYSRPGVPRRDSFASIDGDDKLSQSPRVVRHESQSSNDFEFPPTPTRPGFSHATPQLRNAEQQPLRSSISVGQPLFEPQSAFKVSTSKLNLVTASPGSVGGDGDSDSGVGNSPSANLRLNSSQTSVSFPSSFTRSRRMRNLNSPPPLSNHSLAVSSYFRSPIRSPLESRAKSVRRIPASPLSERFERQSPHTPQENILPPDPSGLSISANEGKLLSRAYTDGSSSASVIPATPTGPKEYFSQFGKRAGLVTTANTVDVDPCLTTRFDKVEIAGVGEFSQVYRVAQKAQPSPFQSFYSFSSRPPSQSSLPEQVWAVKKSKQAYTGAKDRARRIHEVNVLKALGHNDHIISFVDSWEERNHLYIQTEFCEEGSLDVFLAQVGVKGRLDDFRIWKILLELSLGLKHIHDSAYIHLDLKPANVLITFEGVLKIADFGMATQWPAKAGIEGEGDREYIGPEILKGQYDKPADIFALGLIMLETAGNVELPDNGVSWQKLRNGDMSDVPSLTWSSQTSTLFRDSTGNPLSPGESFDDLDSSDDENGGLEGAFPDGIQSPPRNHAKKSNNSSLLSRSGELVEPPAFMIDAENENALDRVVRWMISPEPKDRPIVDDILQSFGVQWAEHRRRAGATVYEGNWGPADEVLLEDAEMIDV